MKTKELKDGEPCSHPGCLSHVTHPCEGCGRVAGKRSYYFTDPLPEDPIRKIGQEEFKRLYSQEPVPEDTLSKDPGLADTGE